MPIRIEVPIGAPADVAELEYCSALRQTSPYSLNSSGAISPLDVMHHLVSRHGVRVPIEKINTDIFRELAGVELEEEEQNDANEDIEKDDNSVGKDNELDSSVEFDVDDVKQVMTTVSNMTLTQQTALLLLPYFQGIKQNWDESDAKELMKALLKLILDRAGIEGEIELNVDNLGEILEAFGLKHDENTLQSMVNVCGNNTELTVLSAETLLRALTADTDLYDTKLDMEYSTHFQDAAGKSKSDAVERFYTAPTIDSTADTYKSYWWNILAWLTLVITFAAYFMDGFDLHRTFPTLDCENSKLSDFGCTTVNGVVTWIGIFIELSVMGSLFALLTSLGNSAYIDLASKKQAILASVAGIIVTVCCTILSYNYQVDTPLFSTEKRTPWILRFFSLFFGCVMVLVQILQLLFFLLPKNLHDALRPWSVAGCVRMERNIKMAASFKIDKMIMHALLCHSSDTETPKEFHTLDESIRRSASSITTDYIPTSPGGAVLRFNEIADERQVIGGVIWTWKKILFDQTLFREEGIWLSTRLVISNVVQFLLFVVLPVLWYYVARTARELAEAFEPTVTPAQAEVGVAAGAIAAILTCGSLAFLYIPSTVCTAYSFRKGIIGSLKDSRFLIYRYAEDQVTLLIGSAFWGALFTAIVTWIVIGAIAFLLVFKQIRELILHVVAGIIGLVVTIIIKLIIMQILRVNWYAALYRKQPVAANVMNVIFECWNLGLSTGYILARTTKLLLVAVFYIGRIDAPFLAPGVGWILDAIPLDSYPIAFRKDLLLHEAHRHPYMERWALLYLLKLRHGENFGRRPNALWRHLVVLALMPWLDKYSGARARFRGRASQKMPALENRIEMLEAELRDLRKQNANLQNMLSVTDDGSIGNRRRFMFDSRMSQKNISRKLFK